MTRAGRVHPAPWPRFPVIALLLLFVGCVTPTANSVVLREGADPQLRTRVRGGLFLTTARIGRREVGPFLLDTGAERIVLDRALATALRLPLRDATEDSTHHRRVQWSTVPSVTVGPLAFHNTDVMVVDLSGASAPLGESLAGLLGAPFFARAVVEVDYATATITCFDPRTYRLPRGEWLPLAFRGNRPIVHARVEGELDARFLLDTGHNGTVTFTAPFAEAHALLANRETGTRAAFDVDGRYEERVMRLGWVEFAGRRFAHPFVTVRPADRPLDGLPGVAGMIGQGFLYHFTVIFHYPDLKIAFLPR